MSYRVIEDYVGNEEFLLIGKKSYYNSDGFLEKQIGYDEQGNFVQTFYNDHGKIYLELYTADYVKFKLEYNYSKNHIVIVNTIIEEKDWQDIITNKNEIKSFRVQKFNDNDEILEDEQTDLNNSLHSHRKNFSYFDNKLIETITKSSNGDERCRFFYENEELKYELREENFKENSFQYHTLYHYGKSNKTEIKYAFTFITNFHLNLSEIELKIHSGTSIFIYSLHLKTTEIKINLNPKLLDYTLQFENYFSLFVNLFEEFQSNNELVIQRNISDFGDYNFEIKRVIKDLNLQEFLKELSKLKYKNEPIIDERAGKLSMVLAVLEDKVDYVNGLIYFKKYYCGNEGILKNGYCIVEDTKLKK